MANLQQLAAEGLKHAEAGRVQQAEEAFQLVWKLSGNPFTRVLLAGVLPAIYQSTKDLQFFRQQLEQRLRALAADKLKIDVTDAFAAPTFLTQYQGLNDRAIQQQRANLYSAPQNPAWAAPRPTGSNDPLRVGIITSYFREHTIGRLNQGLVACLAKRPDIHLTAFSFSPPRDAIGQGVQSHAHRFVVLPPSMPTARKIIADSQLEVLFYTDLGMDPLTYTLALTRLAPVQCVTWGHPVTSGMPTMDYFISAKGLEPAESQDQYTEQVVKLPDLAVYYYRPTIQGPQVGPESFGLPPDAHLYGCPQSLYKFHPEFDPLIAGILRQDPQGILVLLAGQYPEWREQLLKRFARTMPQEALNRIHFIGRQPRDSFLQLNGVCHVLLDPPHFGGGNTTYEALALGTPVVTLPSNMLRGRLAYKMYLTMGMTDCVASSPEQYVEIAGKLGTQPEFRRTIKEKILATNNVLFENPAGVHQLADFWKSVVSR